MKRTIRSAWVAAMAIVLTTGCDESDRRLIELSEQSSARQAEQNRQIARQSQEVTRQTQEVAQATKLLIEADSKARSEILAAKLAHDERVQAERKNLDRQHEQLADDRQAFATAQQREPVIANAITAAATLLGCLLPLVVCIYLMRALDQPVSDSELSELLVREITSHDSPFLSVHGVDRHNAIAGSKAPLLPPADDLR